MAYEEEEEEEEEESYLASYSDLVTDLMAIFVLLFSFAMMATAQQNYEMKQEMQAKNQSQSIVTEQQQQAQDDLDMLYQAIQKKITDSNYENDIALERGEGYITFKFKDSVLFYPDSPVMRSDSLHILDYMGDLLASVKNSLGTVEISGHTAKVSEDTNANTIAWKLSSDRAIAVLKFFVDECDLPQSQMSVAGYAHFRPVTDNDSEEARSQNRRVEIKVTRKDF